MTNFKGVFLALFYALRRDIFAIIQSMPTEETAEV